MSTPPSSPCNTFNEREQNDDSTCHVLPCNIEYTGMAPTHVYFRPVEQDAGAYSSSMFRGRGLVAKKNNKDSHKNLQGALLSIQKDQLQVKASFSNMLEWHHEHHPDALKYVNDSNNRMTLAQEWSEMANVVRY
jgi:hypothetical protein